MHCMQIAALATGFAALPASAADTFRCGGSIIATGLIAAEVRARCGEPDSRDVHEEPIRAARVGGGTHVVGTVRVERWLYDRGYGRFPAKLSFEDGRLIDIELLERK